jgi:cell division septum initiation protein DivIVA
MARGSQWGNGSAGVDWRRPPPYDLEEDDAVLARVVEPNVPTEDRSGRRRPAEGPGDDLGGGSEAAGLGQAGQGDTEVAPPSWVSGEERASEGVTVLASSSGAAVAGRPAGVGQPGVGQPGEAPRPSEGTEPRTQAYRLAPTRPTGPASPDPAGAWSPEAGEVELPAFSVVRRGFDPDEVQAYVEDRERQLAFLQGQADAAERQLRNALEQLAAERRRVEELEARLQASEAERLRDPAPPPSIAALGERVSRILEEAWEAAEALRREAEGAAERAREEARQILEQAEVEARRRADKVAAETEQHRRRVLEELEAARAEQQAALAALQERREAAMAELGRIHRFLQDALGGIAGRAGPGTGESGAAEPGGSGAPEAQEGRGEDA